MEKLIFIGLLIFSVKCFSMDGKTVLIDPMKQEVKLRSCNGPDFFKIVIDNHMIHSLCFYSKSTSDEPGYRRIQAIKDAMANAKAQGKNLKIFLPNNRNKKMEITYFDSPELALKKCEADRDLYRNIAQIMSTNGAGKTESTIEAVADYMSSSAPKSDAKGE